MVRVDEFKEALAQFDAAVSKFNNSLSQFRYDIRMELATVDIVNDRDKWRAEAERLKARILTFVGSCDCCFHIGDDCPFKKECEFISDQEGLS